MLGYYQLWDCRIVLCDGCKVTLIAPLTDLLDRLGDREGKIRTYLSNQLWRPPTKTEIVKLLVESFKPHSPKMPLEGPWDFDPEWANPKKVFKPKREFAKWGKHPVQMPLKRSVDALGSVPRQEWEKTTWMMPGMGMFDLTPSVATQQVRMLGKAAGKVSNPGFRVEDRGAGLSPKVIEVACDVNRAYPVGPRRVRDKVTEPLKPVAFRGKKLPVTGIRYRLKRKIDSTGSRALWVPRWESLRRHFTYRTRWNMDRTNPVVMVEVDWIPNDLDPVKMPKRNRSIING